MPLYEYKNCITGEVDEHLRTVAKRDDVPPHLKRMVGVSMPSVVGSFSPAPTGASQVRENLKHLEHEFGAKEIERQTGFSTKDMKEAWSHD